MSIGEISLRIIVGGTIGWATGSLISSFIFDKLEIIRLKNELKISKLKAEIMDIIYK